MTRPDTCPGYYLTPDEGDKHLEPHCPWQNGNMPEGAYAESFEEFCARCERNQLRADEVNAPKAERAFPAECGVTGRGCRPGELCGLYLHRVFCEVDCVDYRVIA